MNKIYFELKKIRMPQKTDQAFQPRQLTPTSKPVIHELNGISNRETTTQPPEPLPTASVFVLIRNEMVTSEI